MASVKVKEIKTILSDGTVVVLTSTGIEVFKAGKVKVVSDKKLVSNVFKAVVTPAELFYNTLLEEHGR